LNDTIVDLINTVSIADMAPTWQSAAVAKEIMGRADTEIGKVERLAETEIATINHVALDREIAPAGAEGPKAESTDC